MTIKLSSLKADLQREADGDWVEYPDLPGVSFCVRSLQHPAYKIQRDILLQKLARKYKGKPVPTEESSREFGRLYATHILLGWRGFDIDYSTEVAMETLTDPAFRDVVAAVEWCAARVGETTVEFVEEMAKNSVTPSATA